MSVTVQSYLRERKVKRRKWDSGEVKKHMAYLCMLLPGFTCITGADIPLVRTLISSTAFLSICQPE